MLIRCKLFRPGGSRVELGKGQDKRMYHFKPQNTAGLKGPDLEAVLNDPELEHVCDVTDKKDIATLLAVPEGYEVHDSVVGTSAAKAATKAAEEQAPSAKNGKPASAPYSSLKKPDLIKRIVQHPRFKGKAPHGTTPTDKLVAQLEALDALG